MTFKIFNFYYSLSSTFLRRWESKIHLSSSRALEEGVAIKSLYFTGLRRRFAPRNDERELACLGTRDDVCGEKCFFKKVRVA
jgi:hypothetical protein